jgi:hypothetical protein
MTTVETIANAQTLRLEISERGPVKAKRAEPHGSNKAAASDPSRSFCRIARIHNIGALKKYEDDG